MKKRTIVDLIVLVVVAISGVFIAKNALAIGDWWYLRSYTPSEEIAKIADDAGMSDYGKRLFYRLDPQFVDRVTLLEKCGPNSLGCTVDRNIYILNDHTSSQYNRSVVTAAHEMLHVGYSRLNSGEREALRANIEAQTKTISSDLHNKFTKFSGDDYFNEAHSYIGSEEPDLSSNLTEHYDRYFEDRDKVLEALRYSPEGN